MLMLWEVPIHRNLETLTSTDVLLGHICSMGKMSKIFESQPYLAGHMTWTEKKPKTQTTYSFGQWKQCQYLTIIKKQNVTYWFLEIRIILEVTTSQARKFIYFVL